MFINIYFNSLDSTVTLSLPLVNGIDEDFIKKFIQTWIEGDGTFLHLLISGGPEVGSFPMLFNITDIHTGTEESMFSLVFFLIGFFNTLGRSHGWFFYY